MPKYQLRFIYNDSSSDEIYSGGSYLFQGEKYAALSNNNPYLFSSHKRAENAYKKLYNSCVNVPQKYQIEEVKDNAE